MNTVRDLLIDACLNLSRRFVHYDWLIGVSRTWFSIGKFCDLFLCSMIWGDERGSFALIIFTYYLDSIIYLGVVCYGTLMFSSIFDIVWAQLLHRYFDMHFQILVWNFFYKLKLINCLQKFYLNVTIWNKYGKCYIKWKSSEPIKCNTVYTIVVWIIFTRLLVW
jgi:hypothetical protein